MNRPSCDILNKIQEVFEVDFYATVKEKITDIVTIQPDKATYEEIMQELILEKMIERVLNDAKTGRFISDK